jgi:LigD, primase-polymerase domain
VAQCYEPPFHPKWPESGYPFDVSTPLRWEELRQPIDPDAFTISTIFKRLDRIGDLFAPMLKDRQDIGRFAKPFTVRECIRYSQSDGQRHHLSEMQSGDDVARREVRGGGSCTPV